MLCYGQHKSQLIRETQLKLWDNIGFIGLLSYFHTYILVRISNISCFKKQS